MVPPLCPMKDTMLEFISQRDRVSREGPISELNQEVFTEQSTASRVNDVATLRMSLGK